MTAPSASATASPSSDKSPIEQKQMTFAEREADFSWQVLRIMAEFVDGFDFLTRLRRTVTFFGSARVSESDPYYQLARALGKRLAEEQYTVVTGGGPGIMEAGNRGAAEGGGLSVGERHLINSGDLRLLQITDEIEEAVQIIRSAGERAEGGG